MRLVEAGQARLQDPVVRFIPEFAANGKADVTLWHLMTHTAQLGGYDGPLNLGTWDETIERICAAPRESAEAGRARVARARMRQGSGSLDRTAPPPPPPLGSRPSYNPAGIWILGEVLVRVHRRAFSAVIRSELFEPLGMTDCWNGMSQAQFDSYGARIVSGGGRMRAPQTRRANAALANPAGGAIGPARQLGVFYQMALNGGLVGERRFLSEATIADMIRVQASDGALWTFGLGFHVNAGPMRALAGAEARLRYGARPSPATFGHNGASGLIAFADPAHALVVVMIGLEAEVSNALYDDLGLA
jgi:CubicO group peptidase (beta-lactamase class C family)